MPNPTIDAALAQQLICASIQTYNADQAGAAFPGDDPLASIGNPTGLTYVDYFEGQDVLSGRGAATLVQFGLVFSVVGQPGTFVFAFRGTEGIAEWIDDAKVCSTTFQPLHPSLQHPLPADARVEDGFWEIYRSMQKSVFDKLEQHGVKKLVITGHSLGSALSELFTLDVALSSQIPFTTCHFAGPRVGNHAWAAFYDDVTKSLGGLTTRIVNTKDLVPKVPELLAYAHVGVAFEICFDSDDFRILPDYGLRHSANNYARALAHTFGTSVDCQLEKGKPDDLKFC